MRKQFHLCTKHDMLQSPQKLVNNSACQKSLRKKIPKELETGKTPQWEVREICRQKILLFKCPNPAALFSGKGLNLCAQRKTTSLTDNTRPSPLQIVLAAPGVMDTWAEGGPPQSREPSGDSFVLPLQAPADSLCIRQA